MSNPEFISIELEALYPGLQKLKWRDEILKNLMRIKMENRGSERFVHESMVLKFKRHTDWKWKEEFLEKLDDEAKLPLAVSVTKNMEKRFNLSDFRIPQSDYIRLYPKNTKADALAKESIQEGIQEEYEDFSLEDLILHYKVNKIDLTLAKNRFEEKKSELFSAMREKGVEGYKSKVGTFKIMNKDPKYDIEKIFFSSIIKSISFLLKIENSEAFVHDLHTGVIFSFIDSMVYEGQLLELKKGKLFIDGNSFTPFDGFSSLTKKEKESFQPLMDDGFSFVFAEIEIDGNDFFKHCPISSTKVEELIDQGLLEANVLDKYRFIENEKDLSVRFEVTDLEVEAGRKVFFHNRILRRSETLRKRNA